LTPWSSVHLVSVLVTHTADPPVVVR